MTGIADMFLELSTVDGFQLQFDFEQFARIRYTKKRETQREYYRGLMRNKGTRQALRDYEKRPERKAYKRAWIAEYHKRRLREDPVWAANIREKRAGYERARRERLRRQHAAM